MLIRRVTGHADLLEIQPLKLRNGITMIRQEEGQPLSTFEPAEKLRASAPDPYKWPSIALSLLFVGIIPSVAFWIAPAEPLLSVSSWTEVAERIGVTPGQIELGEVVYRSTCAVCHGPTADGIPGMGKPLRNSAFVQEHSDEELLETIAKGRPSTDPENTTGVAMPAAPSEVLRRTQQGRDLLAYIRAIQEPGAPTAAVDQWFITSDPSSIAAAGMTGIGHDLFINTCAQCHGASAKGLPNLGKTLMESPFVATLTDAELLEFVKDGRPMWDPENTTGVDMPPSGGNPDLTDEQIVKIISYIRSLHIGREPFMGTCAQCHGTSAQGLPNLGKSLVDSLFIASLTNEELLEFIKDGRPMWDPENTTGVDMPPSGGNPDLTDEQIVKIISYIRSLHDRKNGKP